jgi:hypothetical protein
MDDIIIIIIIIIIIVDNRETIFNILCRSLALCASGNIAVDNYNIVVHELRGSVSGNTVPDQYDPHVIIYWNRAKPALSTILFRYIGVIIVNTLI